MTKIIQKRLKECDDFHLGEKRCHNNDCHLFRRVLAHIEQMEKRIGALTAENGSLKTVAFQAQEAAKDLAAQVERLGERHCIDCDTGECDVHE